MDGNGRWAKKKRLPRSAGHLRGAERVKEIVAEANKAGVKIVTLFAFSTENWNRPKPEIKQLFSYLNRFLSDNRKAFVENGTRVTAIGRRDRLPDESLKVINEIESLTEGNNKFYLNIALDYGGRWDIVSAARKIACDTASKKITPDEVNEELVRSYLSLGESDYPDLLIRTSGESRISNFLIWGLAYSEFYFTGILWPDFNKREFRKALQEYGARNRRFGEVHE